MGMKHFNTNNSIIKKYNCIRFSEITKKTPEKSLLTVKKEKAGRNSYEELQFVIKVEETDKNIE